jgi:hypothetical protein
LQKTVAACAFKSSLNSNYFHQKNPKKPEISLPKPFSGPSQAAQKAIRYFFQAFWPISRSVFARNTNHKKRKQLTFFAALFAVSFSPLQA